VCRLARPADTFFLLLLLPSALQFGFMLSVYYLAVWVGCGLTVWKALGIW
jgi:hypothetical protein